MHAASRQSLAEARKSLEQLASKAKPEELAALGGELFAVARLLGEDRALRRALADPATDREAREGLAERLLQGKISPTALDVLKGLAGARWSAPRDLGDALVTLARSALLTVAEQDGCIEEVEDELFRFGRILDAEPELRTSLSARDVPPAKRAELMSNLLHGKVKPVTLQLLDNTVRGSDGRHLDSDIEALAVEAASRRGRSVAQVTSAVALSSTQRTRLSDVLSRIYAQPVGLQVEVDPDLLGGMRIRVGDEVIDGSVASRLAEAKQKLPR